MRDEEKVDLLSKILAFLKTKAVFMVDEGHRNADSLWQAIITHGKPSSLPADEQRLFVDIYLALVGCIKKDGSPLKLEDGRLMSEVVQLPENGQARMSKADLDAVLSSLQAYFLDYAPLAISDEEKDEIGAYWQNRDYPKPATVSDRRASENPLEKRQEQLIVLTRGLLQDLLPKVLGMVDEMDYGASLRPDDDTASPRKNKASSLSQYESPDMSSPLTAQRLFQRGLNLKQMKRLVQTHVRDHLEELDQSKAPSSQILIFENGRDIAPPTAAAARFAEWNSHLDPSERMSLDILSANNDAQMERLCKQIGKTPGLVQWYLLECALPQVQVYPEKFSSNYATLLDGSAETIVLSATLGILEQYLYEPAMVPQDEKIRGFRDDMTFQANVVQRACHARNSTLHWFDPCSAKDLFSNLYKQDAERFKNRIRGLVDIGGWTSQNTTAEAASQFLEFNHEKDLGFNGVVYISEPADKNEESTPVLLRRNEDGTYQTDVLQGSNLHTSLRTIGLAPEKLKLFKIFGPSQTTGTDLAFESNAELIVTFGEGMTLWNQIQGIMRGRGFLKVLSDLLHGQGIIWVGYKKLKEQIAPDQNGDHTPNAVMAYGLKQQAKRLHEILRARAYLGIIHIVRNAVDRQINAAPTAGGKIEIHHQHRKAFVDAISRDTHDLYGDPMTMQNATALLQQFCTRFCAEANVVLSHADQALVDGLIDQTSRIMQHMPSRQSVNLSGEMTQHSQNVGQQVQENIAVESAIKNKSKLTRVRDYNDAENVLSLQSPSLLHPQSDYAIKANTLFSTNLFATDLYYSRNAIRIALDTNQTEVGPQLLKPSQWYIAVEEGNQTLIMAISGTDAAAYRKQIKSGEVAPNRRAALISSAGRVACQYGYESSDALLRSDWFSDRITELRFMKGRVKNAPLLLAKMRDWPEEEFSQTWQTIQAIHADPTAIQGNLIAALRQRSQQPEELVEPPAPPLANYSFSVIQPPSLALAPPPQPVELPAMMPAPQPVNLPAAQPAKVPAPIRIDVSPARPAKAPLSPPLAPAVTRPLKRKTIWKTALIALAIIGVVAAVIWAGTRPGQPLHRFVPAFSRRKDRLISWLLHGLTK